jgi:phenylpropionate dioxygenase-like ring-hydroxylating dioxygenase large terminal subunit
MTFLRNAWYAAALSSEVTDKPFARQLLGENIVLFRTGEGIGAVEDRCPHRFAPLSLGKVQGESIECGYHGLRFGKDGRCVLNPHGNKAIASNSHVRGYPAHERYGFIWYWPGDPALADKDAIPEFAFNEDPEHFTPVYGYLDVAANYQLVVDNLLDLSHVEWLHPMFAQSGGVDAHKTEYSVEGTTVYAKRLKPNVELQGLARLYWTSPATRFDARSNMKWMAPSNMSFDLGATECGAPAEEGVCLPNAHLVTPATEYRAHYFWSIARNRQVGDAGASAKLQSIAQRIFSTEDIPMIEAQQRNIGEVTDILALKPVSIEPDIPAVRARRILAELIRNEENSKKVAAE